MSKTDKEKMELVRDFIYELLRDDYPASDYRYARQALFLVLQKMKKEDVEKIELPKEYASVLKQ